MVVQIEEQQLARRLDCQWHALVSTAGTSPFPEYYKVGRVRRSRMECKTWWCRKEPLVVGKIQRKANGVGCVPNHARTRANTEEPPTLLIDPCCSAAATAVATCYLYYPNGPVWLDMWWVVAYDALLLRIQSQYGMNYTVHNSPILLLNKTANVLPPPFFNWTRFGPQVTAKEFKGWGGVMSLPWWCGGKKNGTL